MARSNVPKFGNWEDDNGVPYTVFFDNARKTRVGGKMINPNDPQENPDMVPNDDPSLEHRRNKEDGNYSNSPARGENTGPKTANESGHGGRAQRTGLEHRRNKEDGNYSNSPARGENTGPKTANESSHGVRAQRSGRAARRSGGSEQSIERSPLHPHYQAKVGTGRSSGSPAREGKNHDSIYGTPGRSRLKPTTRGNESPDKVATVPRFGVWDEHDPQSGPDYTHIFNKVREDRKTEAGIASGTPKHPSYGTRAQQPKESKKRGCFCW